MRKNRFFPKSDESTVIGDFAAERQYNLQQKSEAGSWTNIEFDTYQDIALYRRCFAVRLIQWFGCLYLFSF